MEMKEARPPFPLYMLRGVAFILLPFLIIVLLPLSMSPLVHPHDRLPWHWHVHALHGIFS